MIRTPLFAAALVLASVASAPAATLAPSNITTITALNAIGLGNMPTDGGLISLETDGVGAGGLLTSDNLIGVEVNGFTDANQAQLSTPQGVAGVDPARETYGEDFNVDTGILNYETLDMTFVSPVLNRPGADIVVIDIGRDFNDEFDVTIDGVTVTVANNSDVSEGAERFFSIWTSTQSVFASVADLNAATFNLANGGATSERPINLLDLSDFGVAAGDSVSAIALASSGHDLMLVAGFAAPIPEPSSMLLLLGVAAPGLCRRRR